MLFKLVGDVRGAGLLQGIEFVQDRASGIPFPARVRPGKLVEREARERHAAERRLAAAAGHEPGPRPTKRDRRRFDQATGTRRRDG